MPENEQSFSALTCWQLQLHPACVFWKVYESKVKWWDLMTLGRCTVAVGVLGRRRLWPDALEALEIFHRRGHQSNVWMHRAHQFDASVETP